MHIHKLYRRNKYLIYVSMMRILADISYFLCENFSNQPGVFPTPGKKNNPETVHYLRMNVRLLLLSHFITITLIINCNL